MCNICFIVAQAISTACLRTSRRQRFGTCLSRGWRGPTTPPSPFPRLTSPWSPTAPATCSLCRRAIESKKKYFFRIFNIFFIVISSPPRCILLSKSYLNMYKYELLGTKTFGKPFFKMLCVGRTDLLKSGIQGYIFWPVFVDFLRSFKLHAGILTCVLSLFSFFSSFPPFSLPFFKSSFKLFPVFQF